MKKIIKKLFPKQSLHLKAYKLLINNQRSYLYLSGWMKSLQESKPLNRNGEPIPWMNFSFIHFLQQKLKKDFILFEFGSGYSTYFYAEKVQSVISVEYDEKWFKLIKEQNLPTNVEIIFKEKDDDGDYCRVISSAQKEFDVVVIDGADRGNCIKQTIPKLSPTGVFILDDSWRKEYKEGIELAIQSGFRKLDFRGLKPTDNGIYQSSIFYRDRNCFEI